MLPNVCFVLICGVSEQGVAEAEFEKDLERTFKIFFSASYEKVRL